LTAAAAALVLLSLVAGLALALWQASIARAEARRAERVKELLLDIFAQADPYRTRGETLTAQEILEQGVRRVEVELEGEPELAAELLDTIAQIELSLGLLDEAQRLAEKGLTERSRLAGPSSEEAGLSWLTLSEVAHDRGEIDRAAALLAKARPILESSLPPRSPERTRLASIAGKVLLQQGRLEEALVNARLALEETERRFGAEHPETARQLLDLGDILGNLSRFEEAESTLRRAVSIFERSPSVSRLETSLARRTLAEVLERLDKNAEAETLYTSALTEQRAALGAKHPEIAQTLIKVGFLLEETHRCPEAEKALREAHAILAPIGHYDAASALRYLGFCFVRQERYEEAIEVFSQAERVYREKLGSDHPMVWAAVLSRAQAQAKLGQPAQAEAALRRVLERFSVLHGPDSDEIRAPLKSLGELLRITGRPDEALALHRRARAIEQKLFGSTQHAAVAVSDHQIALDLLARPSPEHRAEARRLLDGAAATLREVDPGHPVLDECLLARGRLALEDGDWAPALADLGEALTRLTERRGEDHPRTREAAELLDQAREQAAIAGSRGVP
jgi:serine/threonine-protein kinase